MTEPSRNHTQCTNASADHPEVQVSGSSAQPSGMRRVTLTGVQRFLPTLPASYLKLIFPELRAERTGCHPMDPDRPPCAPTPAGNPPDVLEVDVDFVLHGVGPCIDLLGTQACAGQVLYRWPRTRLRVAPDGGTLLALSMTVPLPVAERFWRSSSPTARSAYWLKSSAKARSEFEQLPTCEVCSHGCKRRRPSPGRPSA
jgi:hypothetical protein